MYSIIHMDVDIMTFENGDGPPSGRFLLRLGPGLHGALRGAAAAAGVSLNEYCALKLAAPLGELAVSAGAARAVQQAAAVAGGALVGVIAFGSWARGGLHDQSDVDLLIVLDETRQLSRALYAAWDDAPVFLDGRRVEPHFVTLPVEVPRAIGLWAEAALDGIVLFARDRELGALLSALRRQLADGRVRRGSAHGQPYWVVED
jgi:predicted nucleotidyltransferase